MRMCLLAVERMIFEACRLENQSHLPFQKVIKWTVPSNRNLTGQFAQISGREYFILEQFPPRNGKTKKKCRSN